MRDYVCYFLLFKAVERYVRDTMCVNRLFLAIKNLVLVNQVREGKSGSVIKQEHNDGILITMYL